MDKLQQLPREFLVTQLNNGLLLIVLGMGVVFIFLFVLLATVKFQSYLVNSVFVKFANNKTEKNTMESTVTGPEASLTQNTLDTTAVRAPAKKASMVSQAYLHVVLDSPFRAIAGSQTSVAFKTKAVESNPGLPSMKANTPGTRVVSDSTEIATGGEGAEVRAPMPGLVLRLGVKVGDSVKLNQILMVMEAMKMENEIFSPVAGTISSILVKQGDQLMADDLLITIA